MIIYYVYFHPSGIDLPFLKKSQRNHHNASVIMPVDDQNQSDVETRQPSVAFMESGTELRPVSRLSVSSPVLDEADYSPSKKCKRVIRRTHSEPPESGDVPITVVDFIKARRSWKSMTRERVQSGDH